MNDGNHERRRKSGGSSTGVRPCFLNVSMRCEGNRGEGPEEITEEDVKVRDAGGWDRGRGQGGVHHQTPGDFQSQ